MHLLVLKVLEKEIARFRVGTAAEFQLCSLLGQPTSRLTLTLRRLTQSPRRDKHSVLDAVYEFTEAVQSSRAAAASTAWEMLRVRLRGIQHAREDAMQQRTARRKERAR